MEILGESYDCPFKVSNANMMQSRGPLPRPLHVTCGTETMDLKFTNADMRIDFNLEFCILEYTSVYVLQESAFKSKT